MLNFACGTFGIIDYNNGFVFQNFVFNLLKQKYHSPTSPINHWRTKDKAEVDFIVHQAGEIIPVEVKYSNLKKMVVSRSFRSFINRYNPKRAMVVNISLNETFQLNNTTVEFIPYWKLVKF